MWRGLLAGPATGVAGQGAGRLVQGRIHAAGQVAGCSSLVAGSELASLALEQVL